MVTLLPETIVAGLLLFFRWRTLAEGLMEINGFTDVSQIPAELQFSDSKKIEVVSTKTIM